MGMKKRYLLLMVPALLLAACANAKPKEDTYSDEDIDGIIEGVLDDVPIEVVPYEGDTSPLELLDKIEQETSESLVKFKKGDKDQYITVIDTNYHFGEATTISYGEYNPTESDVVLIDENDNPINLTVSNRSSGKVTYKVPVSSFEEYHNYHIKLTNDKVKFINKDESIRQITFYSLDINDANRDHTILRANNDHKTFDIDKVEYFDTDAFGAYFIYNEPFDIDQSVIDETGMMFRLANLDVNEDDQDTVYGKLISNNRNPNGGGYIIRYEPCKGNDLYQNLSVNDSITINNNNAHITLANEDDGSLGQQLGHAFATHEDTITTIRGIANHYKISPDRLKASLLEWATKVKISFSMKWDDSTSTFTWGATATLDLNPEDKIDVTLKLSYKQTIRYKVSASLSIEYWLFVPTGINYKVEVTEDDTKEVEFGVMISTNLAPYDEEKVKEAIEDDVLEAFVKNSDVKSKFKGDGGTATSDGRSYPLIRIDCYYFWPLDIRFEIDFYWKCQLTLEATVKYTSHTQRVDVSISNSKGCDPHSESKSVNDKTVTINFMGTFHAEIGLKVSLGIGICGFYKFFHAEIYIAAYGALDAQGFITIGIMWGEDKDATFTGAMGGKIEVSVGVKWGVDIALLFGGYKFEWPIAKAVLIGFAHDAAINNFINDESTVEITDKDYGAPINLDDYHLLGVAVFDSKNFGSAYLDMKHDDGTKTRYGAWVSDVEEKYFSFELTEGSEYVDFDEENYTINIKKIVAIEEFDAEIKVTVNKRFTTTGNAKVQELTKTIKIHFTNNHKQTVYVKDYDGNIIPVGTYVIGIECKLPVPEAPRYMKFVGWKNLTTDEVITYDEDDPTSGTYIPQEDDYNPDVTFEYMFIDYYHWIVVWVDGLGNIVKTEEVMNGESATPPEAAIRDQYMTSNVNGFEYVFTQYDTDYACILQNTVIHAQYELRRIG